VGHQQLTLVVGVVAHITDRLAVQEELEEAEQGQLDQDLELPEPLTQGVAEVEAVLVLQLLTQLLAQAAQV
jgi:hypothetical protein